MNYRGENPNYYWATITLLIAGLVAAITSNFTPNRIPTASLGGILLLAAGIVGLVGWQEKLKDYWRWSLSKVKKRRPLKPLDFVARPHLVASKADLARDLGARFGKMPNETQAWEKVTTWGANILTCEGALGPHLVSTMLAAYRHQRDGWAIQSTAARRRLAPHIHYALIYKHAPAKAVIGWWSRTDGWHPFNEPRPLSDFGFTRGVAVRYLSIEEADRVRSVLTTPLTYAHSATSMEGEGGLT